MENRRDLFKGQRDNMIRETNRMGKLAYSVMARACNRIGRYRKDILEKRSITINIIWREYSSMEGRGNR